MIKFGERIKELRKEKGLTQKQLGDELGYTQACIARWETDSRSPSLQNIVELVKYFDVSADYLLGLQD